MTNLLYLSLFVLSVQGELDCRAGTEDNWEKDDFDEYCIRNGENIVDSFRCAARGYMEIIGNDVIAANSMNPFSVHCSSKDPLNFTILGNVIADGEISFEGEYFYFYAEPILGPYNETCDPGSSIEVFTTAESPANFVFYFLKPSKLETNITCTISTNYMRSRSYDIPTCTNSQYCRSKIVRESLQYRNSPTCDKPGEMGISLEVFLNADRSSDFYPTPNMNVRCLSRFPLDVSHNGSLLISTADFTPELGMHALYLELDTREYNFAKAGTEISDYISIHSARDPQHSFNINFKMIVANHTYQEHPPFEFNPVGGHFLCWGESRRSYLSNLAEYNPTQTKFNMVALPRDFQYENKKVGHALYDEPLCSHLRINEIYTHGIFLCEVDERSYYWEYISKIKDFMTADMSEMYVDENVIEMRKMNSTVTPENYPTMIENVTIYENEKVEFHCVFWEYFFRGGVDWTIAYANGSKSTWRESYENKYEERRSPEGYYWSVRREVAVTNRVVDGEPGLISVTCLAAFWNDSTKFASASKRITVLNSTPPYFEQNETFLTATIGLPLQLHCSSGPADPLPIYYWTFPDTLEDSYKIESPSGGKYSNLTLWNFQERAAGHYTCRARNFKGEAEKHFHVNATRNPNVPNGTRTWNYSLFGVGAMFLILIMVVVVLLRRYYLQKGTLTELEIRYFYKGDTNSLETDGLAHEKAEYMPFRAEYEIKWTDFTISTEKLGSGAFGVVYKGCLNQGGNLYVAVKTVKPGIEKAMLLSLLSEIKVMAYIGTHANIVELIGACTEFLKKGNVYMLVELCPLGCLESFLRNHGSTNSSTRMRDSKYVDPTVEFTPGENYSIETRDMISWSKQIACGMSYLTDKKVIHGDLAARNVLLLSKTHAKITDFGLSHHLQNYQTYAKNSDGMLPWRWMALETLKTFAFSSKSDVWSFGVTLWEIFTLGQVPYPGIKWTPDFVGFLEDNLRLSQPKNASDSLYKIMKMCWNADPEIRPDFQFLQQYMIACEDSDQISEG